MNPSRDHVAEKSVLCNKKCPVWSLCPLVWGDSWMTLARVSALGCGADPYLNPYGPGL